jgi:putative PIN family toxin of toxin-antitoxin system
MTKNDAPLRIVVDTNLFVSGIIAPLGKPRALLSAWHQGAFDLIVSSFQKRELARSLARPRIAAKYGVLDERRAELLRAIDDDAVEVVPLAELPLPVRDPDDERILGAALAAQAGYLVTGDKDLLVLAGDPRLGALEIVTVTEFLAVLAERESNNGDDEVSTEPEGRPMNGVDEP